MKKYQPSVSLRLLLLPLLLVAACGQNPVDPDGFTGTTGGCGNFQVYAFNSDQTDVVVVDVPASDISLNRTPKTFALPNEKMNVGIKRFSALGLMCSGIPIDDEQLKLLRTWNAVSGTVRMAAGDTLEVQPWFTRYKVSVSLHNVTFRDQFGEQVFIKELDYGEVIVGWLAP